MANPATLDPASARRSMPALSGPPRLPFLTTVGSSEQPRPHLTNVHSTLSPADSYTNNEQQGSDTARPPAPPAPLACANSLNKQAVALESWLRPGCVLAMLISFQSHSKHLGISVCVPHKSTGTVILGLGCTPKAKATSNR